VQQHIEQNSKAASSSAAAVSYNVQGCNNTLSRTARQLLLLLLLARMCKGATTALNQHHAGSV
jgi:hypothetical protein